MLHILVKYAIVFMLDLLINVCLFTQPIFNFDNITMKSGWDARKPFQMRIQTSTKLIKRVVATELELVPEQFLRRLKVEPSEVTFYCFYHYHQIQAYHVLPFPNHIPETKIRAKIASIIVYSFEKCHRRKNSAKIFGTTIF